MNTLSHDVVMSLLKDYAAYTLIGMNTILVIGGTGLIGRHLCKSLHEKNYDVCILSRTQNKESPFPIYTYNYQQNKIDSEAILKADVIINLAGAGISDKRWTAKRKQLIIESRIKTNEFIFNKIKEQHKKLKAYISASAIGYYGSLTSDKIFSENDPSTKDFVSRVCKQWEENTDLFNTLGIRTVKIRTAVVLTNKGGALEKISFPIKMGFGSAYGSGKQYIPWIHIDDLCNIYIKAIEDPEFNGIYNAVAPEHITNREFIQSIALILNKSLWFPKIPAFVMKLIVGEMADIILKGSRISAEKIINKNYIFLYPTLKKALNDILNR